MFWNREREGVFKFHDGTRWRAADPIRVHRLINEHGKDEWEKWIAQLDMLNEPNAKFKLTPSILDNRNAMGMEAVRNIADLSRKVFSVSQVDDGGLTDAECVKLFGDFILYAAKIATEYRSFPNPQPDTA